MLSKCSDTFDLLDQVGATRRVGKAEEKRGGANPENGTEILAWKFSRNLERDAAPEIEGKLVREHGAGERRQVNDHASEIPQTNGAVAMIKAVLPGMRARRSGRIVNVTSMGGFITMPGITYCCGSKLALEDISEALGKEVKPLGIHVTAVAPGQFLTNWAGRSMVRAERSIADYDAVMDPIRAARQAKSGNQPGDPTRAAQALLKLVSADNPPVRLYLGADARKLVQDKIDAMKTGMAAWEEVSRSTDFAQRV